MCLKKKNPEVAGYCLCSTVAFVLFYEVSINGIPHLALCLSWYSVHRAEQWVVRLATSFVHLTD